MLKNLQYTLQDNFVKNGLWWLPSEPKNKVGGLLRYRFGMAPRLELMGTLRLGSPSFDPFEADIIQGVTSDGIFCTLCRSVGITSASFPGFTRQVFDSQWLLLGHHFETLDEVQFDSYAINFQYMEEWLFRAPHAADRKHDQGEVVFNIRWPARNLLGKELLITSGKLSLVADPHIANFSNIAINIQSIAYLKWEPESAQPLSKYNSLFFDMQHFFTLLFGESTFPRRIIGYLKKKNEEKEIDWPVSIYYDHQPAIFNPPELSNYDMLISYEAVKDQWVLLLDSWLSKADDFRTIYSLFFGFLSKPDMYLHNRFLNLVQSLEIYHRVIIAKTPKVSVKLYIRLEEILKSLKNELKNLVTIQRVKDFAGDIAKTRNDLVHEGKTQRMEAKEMIIICQRLRILITILLLKRLGLEDTIIEESIARNRRIQPYEI